MHRANFILFMALAAFTAAGTVPTQWGCPTGYTKFNTSQNANFDDLTDIPGATLTPIQTPYKGLFYQAFVLVQVLSLGLGVQPGLIPHSPNNYAATGVASQTMAGTPMLSVNYPNSNVKEFDLDSFYYGCTTATANAAADPPLSCSVTFTGYNGSDNTVAQSAQRCAQTFTYIPSTMTGPQQMAFSGSVNPACKGLTHGTFAAVTSGGMTILNSVLALSIENVKYTTAGCQKN